MSAHLEPRGERVALPTGIRRAELRKRYLSGLDKRTTACKFLTTEGHALAMLRGIPSTSMAGALGSRPV